MSGMIRQSGYHFCDENMPNLLSWHEFSVFRRSWPNEKRAVTERLRRKPFQFVQL